MLANVDTDVIIRIERLTAGDPAALGRYAFEALRYRADGSEDPDCVLNAPKFRAAPILLAGPNFGCGSSREPAVWALMAMGLRCVIAESFGDIFYANCFQMGLLPIRLEQSVVAQLAAEARERCEPFTVDLVGRMVVAPSGAKHAFEIDEFRRTALLEGLDDIGLTLKHDAEISAWQAADREARPWVWRTRAA
jgi:3-isopropylmalate/(R)-2-methylmalate dehydratase small subunit